MCLLGPAEQCGDAAAAPSVPSVQCSAVPRSALRRGDPMPPAQQAGVVAGRVASVRRGRARRPRARGRLIVVSLVLVLVAAFVPRAIADIGDGSDGSWEPDPFTEVPDGGERQEQQQVVVDGSGSGTGGQGLTQTPNDNPTDTPTGTPTDGSERVRTATMDPERVQAGDGIPLEQSEISSGQPGDPGLQTPKLLAGIQGSEGPRSDEY